MSSTTTDFHELAPATGIVSNNARRRRRSSALFRSSLRQSIRQRSSNLLQQELLQAAQEAEEAEINDGITITTSTKQQPPMSCSFWMEALRYAYSFGLLVFSVVLIIGILFTFQATSTAAAAEGGFGLSPFLALFILVILLAWLSLLEGGQGSLVGLQPIEKDIYENTHPTTLQVTTLASNTNGNLDKFIVGRQFLVVLVVFGINTIASALPNVELWNLPELITDIFLSSGLALILITLILGQLVAQVIGADCMLDFINNKLFLLSTYVALALEAIGLLHCTYLVQILTGRSNADDTNDDTNNRKDNIATRFFFWIRVVLSISLLGFALAVTFAAISSGQTTAWEGTPAIVSIISFVSLMALAGILEGMQIALFAVLNMSETELRMESPTAYANCQSIFGGDESMNAILIGRQVLVTVCTFLVARFTTVHVDVAQGETTILGVPPEAQSFINTGLLGALITTILGSLVWRILAASYPIAFLSNPMISVLIRICLTLERSGICSAAWVLARFVKAVFKYEPDSVYLDEAQPTNGSEPLTERDADIDRLFMRSSIRGSIVSLRSSFVGGENNISVRSSIFGGEMA